MNNQPIDLRLYNAIYTHNLTVKEFRELAKANQLPEELATLWGEYKEKMNLPPNA